MTEQSLGQSYHLVRVKINVDKFTGEPTNFRGDGKNEAWFDDRMRGGGERPREESGNTTRGGFYSRGMVNSAKRGLL